ncbi:Arabinose-proton symporter [Klebsiella aerogenes]|nr:Arabinose-proton symporter [Klebsiella aerogenes]
MPNACCCACAIPAPKRKRELDEIRESLKVKQSGWSLFKDNSNFRRAVFLGILLQVMQQFTGMKRHHVLRTEDF